MQHASDYVQLIRRVPDLFGTDADTNSILHHALLIASEHAQEEPIDGNEVAHKLGVFGVVQKAAYMSGTVHLKIEGTKYSIGPGQAEVVVRTWLEYSRVSFDTYLYESPNRPVWMGAISDIEEQAHTSVDLVDATGHSFMIRADDELPEEVLRGFELERVYTIPDEF